MGDLRPLETPPKEDLEALSKASELLHYRKTEAEEVSGAELSPDVSRSGAEAWSHQPSLRGQTQQAPGWVLGCSLRLPGLCSEPLWLWSTTLEPLLASPPMLGIFAQRAALLGALLLPT